MIILCIKYRLMYRPPFYMKLLYSESVESAESTLKFLKIRVQYLREYVICKCSIFKDIV